MEEQATNAMVMPQSHIHHQEAQEEMNPIKEQLPKLVLCLTWCAN